LFESGTPRKSGGDYRVFENISSIEPWVDFGLYYLSWSVLLLHKYGSNLPFWLTDVVVMFFLPDFILVLTVEKSE